MEFLITNKHLINLDHIVAIGKGADQVELLSDCGDTFYVEVKDVDACFTFISVSLKFNSTKTDIREFESDI